VNDPSFAPDLLVKELEEVAPFEQVSELSSTLAIFTKAKWLYP